MNSDSAFEFLKWTLWTGLGVFAWCVIALLIAACVRTIIGGSTKPDLRKTPLGPRRTP